jgi:hypothetical protein
LLAVVTLLALARFADAGSSLLGCAGFCPWF